MPSGERHEHERNRHRLIGGNGDRGDRLRRYAVIVADQPRLLELVDYRVEKSALTLEVAAQIRFLEERDLGLLGECEVFVEFLL